MSAHQMPDMQLGPVHLGPFPVRWYALGYIVGLLAGWWYAVRIVTRGRLWGDAEKGPLQRTDIDDFAFYAMIGILVGGRIGYILFYQLPKVGWGELAKDPLLVFRVWEGGMASHGGILGLVIFTWFYAKKHKVTWTGLGDGLVPVVLEVLAPVLEGQRIVLAQVLGVADLEPGVLHCCHDGADLLQLTVGKDVALQEAVECLICSRITARLE